MTLSGLLLDRPVTIQSVPLFRSLVFCRHPRSSVCGSGEGLFYFPLRGSSTMYLPWCAASARLVPYFSPGFFSIAAFPAASIYFFSTYFYKELFSGEKKIFFGSISFFSISFILSQPSSRRVFILFSAVSTTVRGYKSSSFNLGVIASGRDYVTPKATAAFCELIFHLRYRPSEPFYRQWCFSHFWIYFSVRMERISRLGPLSYLSNSEFSGLVAGRTTEWCRASPRARVTFLGL